MARERESENLARFRDFLRARGCAVWRRNVAGNLKVVNRGRTYWVPFGAAGQSDLWGILPDGRHLECEVKRPGERPTPEQVEWMIEVNARKGVAFWADRLEYLETIFDAVMRGYRVEMDARGEITLTRGCM